MVDGSIRWGRMALAAACAAALALGVVVLRPPKAFAEEAEGIEVVDAQPISLAGDGGTGRGRGTFADTPVVSYVGADGTKGRQECSILDDSAAMPIKGGWWLLDADTVAKDKVIEVLGDAHFVCSGPVDLGAGYVHVAKGASIALYAEAGREADTALTTTSEKGAVAGEGTIGKASFPVTRGKEPQEGKQPKIGERIPLSPCVNYQDENGSMQSRRLDQFECDLGTFQCEYATLNNAWYYVSQSNTIEERIEVAGNATIVICNGATLRCLRGIHVPAGKSLTVYCENGTQGAIDATIVRYNYDYADGYPYEYDRHNLAGIGGNDDESCGVVTLCDAKVTAKGIDDAAGIGGGRGGSGGKVSLSRCRVGAHGAEYSAGIGGGGSYAARTAPGNGGIVIIRDSIVYAKGNDGAAGIGGAYTHGGDAGNGGDVTIIGNSVVEAESPKGAAIGRGHDATGVGTVHFSDNLRVVDLCLDYNQIATFGEREGYCRYRKHVRVEPGESRK